MLPVGFVAVSIRIIYAFLKGGCGNSSFLLPVDIASREPGTSCQLVNARDSGCDDRCSLVLRDLSKPCIAADIACASVMRSLDNMALGLWIWRQSSVYAGALFDF